MPKYTFKCAECEYLTHRTMSVSDFFKSREERIKCDCCKDGTLFHQIIKINSSVEKSKDQIMIESKDEIRKTVDKVRAGDTKTIKDIYGDRPNPYKTQNNGAI